MESHIGVEPEQPARLVVDETLNSTARQVYRLTLKKAAVLSYSLATVENVRTFGVAAARIMHRKAQWCRSNLILTQVHLERGGIF